MYRAPTTAKAKRQSGDWRSQGEQVRYSLASGVRSGSATPAVRCASEQSTTMRMTIMRTIRWVAVAGLGSLACLGAMAQNNGPLQTPQAQQQRGQGPAPLIATPRQDRHDGLSISVDPYNEPGRAKEKFGKANPLAAGILPIEVSMRNDTDRPIRV